MNKNLTTILSVLVVVAFIGYIIYDTSRPGAGETAEPGRKAADGPPDMWTISDAMTVREGKPDAVAVSAGRLYAAGASFVSAYDSNLTRVWSVNPGFPVTALCISGDTLFAATAEVVLLLDHGGKIIDEWGPFEDKSYITSVASNRSHVVYADAGNKMVVVLDKHGRVMKIIGQNDGQFVLPSPYFDVAIDREDNLYIANTGHRRIETRSLQGQLISMFGEPGLAPGAFCGCCNPAHFALVPQGFITAEKGINRIKILGGSGDFTEFVSSRNRFQPSVPVDVASEDGKVIYAANPSDSKIYKFIRK